MRSDVEVLQDVQAELQWTADLDETDISVNVHNGVVLLAGFVGSYREKHSAESAAKRVRGVVGISNDIEVRIAARNQVADPQIARAAVLALQSALPALWEQLKVLVSHGRIILEGSVECEYQRRQAAKAVRGLAGVTAVTNHIRIAPIVKPVETERRIRDAILRNAFIDAEHVAVLVMHEGEVTLKGVVTSLAEREAAERTAWSAPGVHVVKNELSVRPELGEL